MLDLEEQETNFVQRKDYAQAQRIAEELTACREEYMNMLKPILKEVSSSDSEESRKFVSSESLLIIFVAWTCNFRITDVFNVSTEKVIPRNYNQITSDSLLHGCVEKCQITNA